MREAVPTPRAVHGPNQLTIDIVEGVIADVGTGRQPVTVLVDPDVEHWDAIDGHALVVVLSKPSDDAVVSAIRRGADAVVDADDVVEVLPKAIAAVGRGRVALTADQARLVVEALRRCGDGRLQLTRRENDIVGSIVLGDSVKQTALRLGVAVKTVENLQGRLFRKLQVRNRAQAVARVHALGLLPALDAERQEDAPVHGGGLNP